MLEIDLVFGLSAAVTAIITILVYTYLVFPVAMAIIGRRRPALRSRPEKLPSVSLVIPAHNEEDVIARKIKNSKSIDYPNLEIIVASDGSTDRTNEIVGAFGDDVRLLDFAGRRGKASVVADAVAVSSGEILCLCDANVMFRPDALWRLVARLSSKDVGGVTGDVRLQSEQSSFGLAEALYYRLERRIHSGESNLGAVMGVDGGMYVIRRELFCELPVDTVLDDFSISMHVLRAGKKLLYEPTAIADENSTELAMDEFRRRVRIGVGAAQVISRGYRPSWLQPGRMILFVSHKLLRWMSPWLLLGLLGTLIGLSFCECFAFWFLFPILLTSGIALVGALLPKLRRHWVVAIPFYFVLSQVAMAWGVVRGLLFDSSGVWARTKRLPLLEDLEQ